MADISWVMWNCSGLLPTSSAEEKMRFLAQAVTKFDILVLIETHHKNLSDILPHLHVYSNNFKICHTAKEEGDPYGGIAILVSKNLTVIQETNLLSGRLLNLTVQSGKETYSVSAFYGYTGNNASMQKMTNIIELLETCHNTSDKNIILGDFNFVDNNLDRTNQKRLGMNHMDRTLSSVWTEFVHRLDISDPFRERNPKKRMYSYVHTKDNAKSRLDRVYMNDEKCSNIFYYKHTLTPFTRAHRILSFTLKKQNQRGPGYWKMNTSIISDRAYSIIVDKCINDVMALGIEDPIEQWMVFIQTIRLETQVYCRKKKSVERKVKTTCERNIEFLEQNPRLSQDPDLQEKYEHYSRKLNSWYTSKIAGHQVRIKTQPKLEFGEPEISFFADLEKKTAEKKTVQQLKDSKGESMHETDDILNVATEYYSDLFSAKTTDRRMGEKLLQNVVKRISAKDKDALDRMVTMEELEKAVMKLNRGKSPGPDGIPAEFYQKFWLKIQDLYLDFINAVKTHAIPVEKNVSYTTLIFKEKGDPYLLANYRPIALMNVDVKILSKLLSMRLLKVLPTVIHETQTAVYGRRIDNTVHLVRDLIDLANQKNEEGALLFLDQEKAFDRVNHEFLLKVLKQFGFGESFIHWIEILYTNASTQINVNGFLTNQIPLKSGVRQGCPLSAMLYVLVIEILALQLRTNPNIVGFSVQGEKLISSHYSDDAVIKITQNRCFKEVYKDLQEYEMATGARINFEKSKGLWLGKWKSRTDDPFLDLYSDPNKRIKWTNGNVKYLGIYVGNTSPALQTFTEIIPKIIRGLNFWKPLKLPILAKARVIEIYHASKLWYAANFYAIPAALEKEIDDAFVEFLIYPKTQRQTRRKEMEKLREFGGIKLMNTKLKSETPKAHWLIRMITDSELRFHRQIFNEIIGLQKGQLTGDDVIFAEASYVKKHLKTDNAFYKEAFGAIAKLYTFKCTDNIENEHLFYNPIFTTTIEDDMHDATITPFEGNEILRGIKTYGDLQRAETTITNSKLLAAIRRKKDLIHNIRETEEGEDCHWIISWNNCKKTKFNHITQKIIYSELIHEQSSDHVYKTKWYLENPDLGVIDWNKVWDSVHQSFFTEKVKSTIWEQIHVNFYTTYNYNKWHETEQPCPLCRKIPDDIFHIILDCKFTKVMWKRIEKTLIRIYAKPITRHEMAFGVQPRSKHNKEQRAATTLRNWITFTMRHLIMLEERKAFKANTPLTNAMQKYFVKFNYYLQEEMRLKKLLYDFRDLSHKFKNIATVNNAIAIIVEDEYEWKNIFL